VDITSEPEGGTTVLAWVPFAEEEANQTPGRITNDPRPLR
jgi:hypothetical protein